LYIIKYFQLDKPRITGTYEFGKHKLNQLLMAGVGADAGQYWLLCVGK
jgi:hypothetical protein